MRRVLPADQDLLMWCCAVSGAALVTSLMRVGHAASAPWAVAGLALDAMAVLMLARAITRVTQRAADDGLAVSRGLALARLRSLPPATVRLELQSARLAEGHRRLVAAAALGGACALIACRLPTGRPDHWIVSMSCIAVFAAMSALVAQPVVTLLVDVEHRRIESTAGVFTLAHGASLRVVGHAGGRGAHALVIEGSEAPPVVSSASIDPDQLARVAHALAALMGQVEVLADPSCATSES